MITKYLVDKKNSSGIIGRHRGGTRIRSFSGIVGGDQENVSVYQELVGSQTLHGLQELLMCLRSSKWTSGTVGGHQKLGFPRFKKL